MMPIGGDDADLNLLREELRLAAEASRRGNAGRQDRIAAGRDLVDRLSRAGEVARESLLRAGAPLTTAGFIDNNMVLERANTWSVRNVEGQFGRCLVSSLSYETGLAGPNRIGEIQLWSGFGVITTEEGEAVIVAAHIVGHSVAWSESRLVPLGTMEAEQAIDDLAAGLRDHAAEGLGAFLKAFKYANRQG